MKQNIKTLFSITLIIVIIIGCFSILVDDIDAAVPVKGYYRKDGTYVKPHYRSNPDGNPYNNWSFPGNTNPYTGKVAPGNPDTYLKNYYSGTTTYAPPALSVTNNLLSLTNNTLIRRRGGTKVYKIIDGKKYWIPTVERFKSFGYRWSDVSVVSTDFTNDIEDGTLTYAEGTLVKSSIYPFVWLIKNNSIRKWIVTGADFEQCGFKWYNIHTILETEIQSLDWGGNNVNGTVTYPSCL